MHKNVKAGQGKKGQAGRKGVKEHEDIKIHCVQPGKVGDLYDLHTHGLEAHGHKDFQALCPGFTASRVGALLRDHVAGVLDRGERFNAGEYGEVHGFRVGYVEVPGHSRDEPTRLRIVDAEPSCSHCGERGQQTDRSLA